MPLRVSFNSTVQPISGSPFLSVTVPEMVVFIDSMPFDWVMGAVIASLLGTTTELYI